MVSSEEREAHSDFALICLGYILSRTGEGQIQT